MIEGLKRRHSKATAFELLCIPFLDTDMPEDRERANIELRERGFPGWLVQVLRKVCAVGLWTQSITWEEWHLDGADVLAGYGLLLLIFAIFIAVFGILWFPLNLKVGGLIAIIGVSALAAGVYGWSRRRRRWEKER